MGEHSVKSRIKHVMNYRKPVVWMSAIAVVFCFVCGMGLMTSPKSNKTGFDEQIEKQIIKIDEAVINEKMVTQKYAGTLAYADENIAIFHGYYGLYVYDMQQEQILRSIDLQKLGFYDAEGKCMADIWTNEKGNLIYIQKEDSRELFTYDIVQNQMTLEKDSVQCKADAFDHFRLLSECVEPDYTTARSEYCVPMADGTYLYLVTGSGMIEDLAMVKEDENGERWSSAVFQLE